MHPSFARTRTLVRRHTQPDALATTTCSGRAGSSRTRPYIPSAGNNEPAAPDFKLMKHPSILP